MAPPHTYCRNLAERAICTFKEHSKSLRSACDPNFPKNLWCQLIPQYKINLNILCQERLYQQLSAYNAIWGAFDYNQMPLASTGTCVFVQENPKQQSMWGDNGVEGMLDLKYEFINGVTGVTLHPLMDNVSMKL